MSLSIEEIARAISGHEFSAAYPHLADDVIWDLVGGEVVIGKDAVIEACETSAAYLADVQTRFDRFRLVAGANAVVVDTRAEYEDADGERSVVASCDIYDFHDGKVKAITSFNIELPPRE